MEYFIARAKQTPVLDGSINDGAWAFAPAAAIASFNAKSSRHRPAVLAKLLHDDHGLHGLYTVRDRYVRAVHTEFQSSVCRDSCVECFIQPGSGPGYINFEFSLSGGVLASWITDPRRTDKGFACSERLPDDLLRQVTIVSSQPGVTEPEIDEPLDWWLGFTVPWSVFATYVRHWSPPRPGAIWRGNFYKCADDTSHPHWASWNPVGEPLNFHQPAYFGTFRFG